MKTLYRGDFAKDLGVSRAFTSPICRGSVKSLGTLYRDTYAHFGPFPTDMRGCFAKRLVDFSGSAKPP